MTDSVDRKEHPPMPDKVKKSLQKYKRSEVDDYADLPTYVRTACAMHELMGMTWKEIGERLGKSPGTVEKYKKYAAYKAWREELQEASKDPVMMAEIFLKSSALGVTAEYLAAFQKSIDAGDYDSTAKMAKDLLDRAGVSTKQKEGPMSIKLVIPGGGSIEAVSVESSVEDVDEADFEVVDE